MRVKVCGITTEDDLRLAADAGADAGGLVASVPVDSPRELSVERAASLVEAAPPFVSTTLVTIPDGPEEAAALLERVEADHLQVHGLTDPEALERLRDEAAGRVVAAVDAEDRDVAERIATHVDGLLVDSTGERGAGGTGETHDWEATGGLAASVDTPVVLAGGLTPENVATAIRTAEPYGVDAASGVERRGGEKDDTAVRAFVDAARAAAGEGAA